jgi:hypothetical protein
MSTLLPVDATTAAFPEPVSVNSWIWWSTLSVRGGNSYERGEFVIFSPKLALNGIDFLFMKPL